MVWGGWSGKLGDEHSKERGGVGGWSRCEIGRKGPNNGLFADRRAIEHGPKTRIARNRWGAVEGDGET